MYIPEHFLVTDSAEIDRFIESNGFGQLISTVANNLFANNLPLLYRRDENKLLGHIARANPQWQDLNGQKVLVILAGPHDYVSPNWYTDPGVPTWNFQAVHISGRAKTLTDPESLTSIITALTAQYESRFDTPWVPDWEASKVKGIVGIEIEIEQILCKYKLSQNRSGEERLNVARQLLDRGNAALSDEMQKTLIAN